MDDSEVLDALRSKGFVDPRYVNGKLFAGWKQQGDKVLALRIELHTTQTQIKESGSVEEPSPPQYTWVMYDPKNQVAAHTSPLYSALDGITGSNFDHLDDWPG